MTDPTTPLDAAWLEMRDEIATDPRYRLMVGDIIARHRLAIEAAIRRDAAERVRSLPVEQLDGSGAIGLVEEHDYAVVVVGRSAVLAILTGGSDAE